MEDISCESSYVMMKVKGYLDLFIFCGGVGLINVVVENVIVLVIEIGIGIVYVYVDKDVDEDKVLFIINNVKISCFFVCNVMEVLFVYEDKAVSFFFCLE